VNDKIVIVLKAGLKFFVIAHLGYAS